MTVVIYKYDDWQGLFVDGVKVYEQHEVRLEDMKKYCPDAKIKYIDEVWVDEYDAVREYLYENGQFPDYYDELLGLMEQG